MPQELKLQEVFKIEKAIPFATMKACVHEATATALQFSDIECGNFFYTVHDQRVFIAVEKVLTVGIYDNVKEWLIFQRSIMYFFCSTQTNLMNSTTKTFHMGWVHQLE